MKIYDRFEYMKEIARGTYDPLSCNIYYKIKRLRSIKNRQIDYAEQGRPELISFNEYNTVDLWWLINFYNGLDYNQLTAGTFIKIPYVPHIDTFLQELDELNSQGTLVKRRKFL